MLLYLRLRSFIGAVDLLQNPDQIGLGLVAYTIIDDENIRINQLALFTVRWPTWVNFEIYRPHCANFKQ